MLAQCEGKFLLSGYPSDMYDEMAKKCGWHHVDFCRPNNAAGGEKKRRMTERMWMNFLPRGHLDSRLTVPTQAVTHLSPQLTHAVVRPRRRRPLQHRHRPSRKLSARRPSGG